MMNKLSFSKLEKDIRHEFRNNMNHAESTEDVKKFFFYTVRDILDKIFGDKIAPGYEDIRLVPEQEELFMFNDNLTGDKEFIAIWNNSDLPRIIGRLADTAVGRYTHLEKSPAKTEAKIYHTF